MRQLALVLVAAFGVACGSDDDGAEAAAKLDGLVHSTVFDEDAKVVAGVEMCVVGRPEIPCATTDELGIGELAVPKNAELVLSYEKAEFVSKRRLLFSDESHETGLGPWILQRKAWYDAVAQQLGGSIDYQLGMIGLQTGPIEGVTFAVEPAAGKLVQFMTVNGKLEGCPASSTTCDFGVGGFFDVPPGKYRATFAAPNKTCTPKAFACADGTPECVDIEVVAGELSFAFMTCD